MSNDILVIEAHELSRGWTLPVGIRAAIIVGDSVHEVLPHLALNSLDAVITDPPYSSGGLHRGDRAKTTAEKYLSDHRSNAAGRLPDFFGDTRSALGHLMWFERAMSMAWQAARDGAFLAVFSDWRQLTTASLAIEGAGWVQRGIRPWVKPPGMYRSHWHYPGNDSEFVLWGTRGPIAPWEGAPTSPQSPWMHRQPRGSEKRHQTEKPLQVMRDLVRVVPPAGIVLDPFAGSGTTLEAALIEGRRCIGVEMSLDYARVIARRLGAAATSELGEGPSETQPSLFGGPHA